MRFTLLLTVIPLTFVRQCGAFMVPIHQQQRTLGMTQLSAQKYESTVLSVPTKKQSLLRRTLIGVGTGAAVALIAPLANAAAEASPHLGEKVATALQASGVPDFVIIAAIAAMPVVELRGALPVGVWMGVPLAKTLALCVLGNMLPIVPLLLALRTPIVQRVLDKPLTKARKKKLRSAWQKSLASTCRFCWCSFSWNWCLDWCHDCFCYWYAYR